MRSQRYFPLPHPLHLPLIHLDHAIAQHVNIFGRIRGNEYHFALLFKVNQILPHFSHTIFVKPVHRLVENQEVGVSIIACVACASPTS